MKEVKQVIVMRTDLNMRKGKMVAQGAHAAMAFLTNRSLREMMHTEAVRRWLAESFTKICVGVDSEKDLMKVYRKAKCTGVHAELIEDNGTTEFHGVPTYTCLALGPDWSDRIDEITGDLQLL